MNNSIENNKNLITGLCIIFICLGLFAFSLKSGIGFQKGSQPFFIILDDISGLAVSNKVRVEGVTAGFVESLSLSDDNRAKVKVLIDKSVKLHKGALAQLRTKTFLGGRFIEIAPGNQNEEVLKAGATIPADISPVTPDQLSAFFSKSFKKEGNLFEEFSETMDNLDKISDHKKQFHELKSKAGQLLTDLNKLRSWYLRSEKLSDKLSKIDVEQIPQLVEKAQSLQQKLQFLADKVSANYKMDDDIHQKTDKLKQELLKLSELLSKVANGQSDLLEKTDKILIQLLVFDEKTLREIFQKEGIVPLKDEDKINQRIIELEQQKQNNKINDNL